MDNSSRGIWPEGKVAAAAFTFDVDGESALLASGPNIYRHRLGLVSHQMYGPRIGVPNILGALRRYDICATFFVPGYVALRHPSMVRAIIDGGHEVAHHGFAHLPPHTLSVDEQLSEVQKGIQALTDITGSAPRGYRAPMWSPTVETLGALAASGITYDSSLMNDERPYRLLHLAGGRSLIELPIQWTLDDWEQYCYLPDVSGEGMISSPRRVTGLWRDEFDGIRRRGGCWILTNHPFLSGRPARLSQLECLMEYVVGHRDTYVANLVTLADWATGRAWLRNIMVEEMQMSNV